MTAPQTAIALTIAGSDSSGGAGIQADLKTFGALGVHGASAIAALTAQNTQHVEDVLPVPPEFVLAQMRTVASDLDVKAIKIGRLATGPIIEAVADGLKEFPGVPVVLDPVMASHSGDPLLDEDAVGTLKSVLMPAATRVTPNLYEAEMMLGEAKAHTEEKMAAQVGARIQPQTISAILRPLTAFMPLVSPTPTIAPTIAWEVDTGIPMIEKTWTPAAADACAAKAPPRSSGVMFFPTASVTRRPNVSAPTAIATPPSRARKTPCPGNLLSSGPIAFPTSFAPSENET